MEYFNNSAFHDQSQRIQLPRSVTVIAAACAIIFSVVGFFGNLVTIIALLKCSKLRKHTTTAFVLNLSLSDLIFSAVNLPLVSSRYFYVEWVLGSTLCRVFPLLFYGNVAVSLLSMVAIALNRYILITRPDIYKNYFSKIRNIVAVIIAIWIASFVLLTLPLFGWWGTFGLEKKTFSCTILRKNGHSPKKAIFFLGFLLPFFIIVISYFFIYLHISRSRKNLAAYDSANTCSRKTDSRVTRLMLTIFVCFTLCFMPLMLVNTIDEKTEMPILHVIASVLAWASAVINPFIYAVSSKLYRQAYKKLFCYFSKSRKNHANNPATSSRIST